MELPAPASLLGIVVPPSCLACHRACAHRERLCGDCERDLAAGRPVALRIAGVEHAWAARPLAGVARRLVWALKSGRLLAAADRIAELIAAEAPPELIRGRVVPVPGAPLRRLARGFEPAERIAAGLAELTGAPPADCLARSPGRRQVGRTRAERIGSPPRFRVRGPSPAQALLVDDVATTGATLAACAQSLRRAGSSAVTAVVFAAAPSRLGSPGREA